MATVRAEVFPAGEFLADELVARGWTQADFADILGRPPQFVSEIITGKKEITREDEPRSFDSFIAWSPLRTSQTFRSRRGGRIRGTS